MAPLIACITTRNEADSIGWLVKNLADQGITSVIVDAQSEDGTGRIARAAGAIVIERRCSIRDGLLTGLRIAKRAGAERVLTIDAGFSHLPSEAGLLLEESSDVVIGSRFTSGSSYLGCHCWRARLSTLYSKMMSVRTGTRIADWTSGYRVLGPEAVSVLLRHEGQFRCEWHAWQAEALEVLISAGMTCKEVPITYIGGRSSLRTEQVLEAILLLASRRKTR